MSKQINHNTRKTTKHYLPKIKTKNIMKIWNTKISHREQLLLDIEVKEGINHYIESKYIDLPVEMRYKMECF